MDPKTEQKSRRGGKYGGLPNGFNLFQLHWKARSDLNLIRAFSDFKAFFYIFWLAALAKAANQNI